MNIREVRFEIEELITAYVQCLDDARYEEWPDFFTDQGVYKIVSRENVARGLPLATMSCTGRGMMRDRVIAIREACVFSPRFLRHLVSSVMVMAQEDDCFLAQSNYVVFQTLQDEETKVFNAGKYVDRVVFDQGKLRFKEKTVIYDTVQIPGLLVIPI